MGWSGNRLQIPARQFLGRQQQQGNQRPGGFHQDILLQAYPAEHPHQVLRIHQRENADGDASYQIAATERILQKINVANNYKLYGKTDGGGYIWHTTGSGKTLTSFKTAQLASRLPYIDKVLFVVDRKDLDYQTMKEYNRFEEGAANGNSSTAVLQRQLENKDKNGGHHDYRIIVTTIQKLSIFIQKNKNHPVFQQRVVIIFDECHRSNFGEMHTAITKNFKKYHMFGFTGTPIFAQNAGTGGDMRLKTTQLDQQSRDFLEGAIKDYNQMFSTNYDTSGEKIRTFFEKYFGL